MNHECDSKQMQGYLWLGQFIKDEIDTALRTKRVKGWESSEKRTVKIIGVIMAPLLEDCRIPTETLEQLKLEFVPPSSEAGNLDQTNDNLRLIGEVLKCAFGQEVMKRIKLSLGQDKIRDIPPR